MNIRKLTQAFTLALAPAFAPSMASASTFDDPAGAVEKFSCVLETEDGELRARFLKASKSEPFTPDGVMSELGEYETPDSYTANLAQVNYGVNFDWEFSSDRQKIESLEARIALKHGPKTCLDLLVG